jgi:hypothetical protein
VIEFSNMEVKGTGLTRHMLVMSVNGQVRQEWGMLIEDTGSLVVQWRSRGTSAVLDCVPCDGNPDLSQQYGSFLALPSLKAGERVLFSITGGEPAQPPQAPERTASQPEKPLRQVLTDYYHKRVGDGAVWRAAVSHPTWLVPLYELNRHYHIEEGETLYALSGEPRPRGALVLYSDPEAASRAEAEGLQPGPVAGAFAGDLLFSNLAPDWNAVLVNPGSEPDQLLAIQTTTGDLYRLAAAWAKAIRVERAIKASRDPADPRLLQELRNYGEFMVLIDSSSGGLVTLQHFLPGIVNGIVAFTAPDCRESVLQGIATGSETRYRPATISGDRLLQPYEGCDGIIINPLGPGPVWGLPRALMLTRPPEVTSARPSDRSAGMAPSAKKPWWKFW